MNGQAFPLERVAIAGVAVLLLTLAGVVWLGFANERLRQQVTALDAAVAAIPPAAPATDVSGLAAQVKATREAVDKLAARVEALRGRDDAKALDRLAGEIRAVGAKVEALAAARKSAPKNEKTQKNTPPSTPRRAPATQEEAPRPFYGPGYPAWPGY
jgi:uncharacterized iron-regulated membrane protein